MTATRQVLTIGQTRTQHSLRSAAGIWARATARRDGLDHPADTAEALDGIRRRLTLPDASLHCARQGGTVVGFVVLVPRGQTLEITYLAVDPDHWGSGVATELLDHVKRLARVQRFTTIDLWVIADNARAIGRYEGVGFTTTTDVQDAAGRLERRMELRLY